jgi:hypothetical protein
MSEEDDTPSISKLAQASEAAYTKRDAPPNYTRMFELSTPDVSTFRHNTDPHYIIAHRGTDLNSPTVKKDLKEDFKILIGDKSQSQFMKDRTKQTEDIVRKIKEQDPEHKIHLTGHSLGAVSSQTALIKSQVVRDNVDTHHTFNAGTSPFKMKDLSPTDKRYKIIADKSTHHRISGDDISRHIKTSMIGKTKTYKSTVRPSIGQHILDAVRPIAEKSTLGKLAHFGATRLLGTLQNHSIKNFILKNGVQN